MRGCSFVERFQKLLARACDHDRDLIVRHLRAVGHVNATLMPHRRAPQPQCLSLKCLVRALADCTVCHARWQWWVVEQAASSSACQCITA